MTPNEHLAEAERLLALAERTSGDAFPVFTEPPEDRAELRDRARTHALLADTQALLDPGLS